MLAYLLCLTIPEHSWSSCRLLLLYQMLLYQSLYWISLLLPDWVLFLESRNYWIELSSQRSGVVSLQSQRGWNELLPESSEISSRSQSRGRVARAIGERLSVESISVHVLGSPAWSHGLARGVVSLQRSGVSCWDCGPYSKFFVYWLSVVRLVLTL